MSRMVQVALRLTSHEMYNVVRGIPIFTIDKVYPYSKPPLFEDYLKMVDRHEAIFDRLPFKDSFEPDKFGVATRNCLDIARLAAYDSRENGNVIDWEKWLDYVPYFLYNYVASTLTLNQFKVLGMCNGSMQMTQQEMAEELEVSQPYVAKVAGELKKMGLLKINEGDLITT